MDRRFQVFVSSTYLDLKDERAAVVSALLQMDAFPAGMELFPATDEDAWSLITRVIDASDYYLLVIGGKYGSVDPALDVSYTEKEYDYATTSGKPVLAFLHADPDSIPLGKSEKDAVARQKLLSFRAKVQAQKHVKFWTGSDDLAGKVALSFASFVKTYPAVGWVRGDVQTSTESLRELNDLRKQIGHLESQLEASRTGPPAGAQKLAQGDDAVTFALDAQTRVTHKATPYVPVTVQETYQPELTWDRIFSVVGTYLLDEAEQSALLTNLNGWLTKEFGGRFRVLVRRSREADYGEIKSFRSTKIQLREDDFGTVLIQLKALGLIQRSAKKRSVSDKGAYWTLTPYGDDHLTELRAISRVPLAGGGDGEEEEEEE